MTLYYAHAKYNHDNHTKEITMYERFTDLARVVMQLAHQEASRWGHKYIGTEHILLGLVKEGHGVAATVLKNLGVDIAGIRRETEEHVKYEVNTQVTIGKLPHTPRTKQVVENAVVVARQLGHNYVRTEHILLGFLMVNDGVGAEVIKALGVDLDKARDETLEMLGYTNKNKRTYAVKASGGGCEVIVGFYQSTDEADDAGKNFMGLNTHIEHIEVSYKIERK